ncbi:hydantoinase/oxoprolinase family protein [Mycobacterium sp. 3519A]|uniref:hydantoinase/oxoprolinase family protein n=1 Tax=Mycobacterium sp. 3519A TaxID=2057184 RepID=UPI000C7B22E1|nr:hydantoinase/oxoprolinase family protein [Mycobacterium sp. 3519A]
MTRQARYRVATDTGGTFTDFVIYDAQRNDYHIMKVPSTPDDPSRAVVNGLATMRKRGIAPERVEVFMHGTTVGTNALLEERGAKAGLAITRGFRGVYETMEQSRPYGPAVFDLGYTKPAMLTPQSRTVELAERVSFDGEVSRPLAEEDIQAAIVELEAADVESVAVCFLFSFMHPDHEQRFADAVRLAHPEWFVTTSSDLLPQMREYYRLSTTVINAYVSPVLARYVARLSDELDKLQVAPGRRFTMQSNGGSAPFAKTGERGVSTILSGPAGGVTAAIGLGRLTSADNIITFDMGGTSCDVALIRGGSALVSDHNTVDGRHLAVPMLDINTVSAGGGTIARVDAGGGLRVGPRSAGAVPGPAAYGNGGTEATVTDADVVLGYLNPDWLLDGDLRVDSAAAHRVIDRLAQGLGVDPLRAADGIVRVVNIKMAEAIRAISTERGFDLRDFCLVPFGGAGPLHACQIAIDLGIPTVLVPPAPGATSALGLLMSDVKHDFVRSRLSPLADLSVGAANQIFGEMTAEARKQLAAEGFPTDAVRLEYFLDLRYAGQGYENAVPVDKLPIAPGHLAGYRDAFDEVHRQFHGHAAPDQPVEVVSYRTVATGLLPDVTLKEMTVVDTPVEDAIVGIRAAYFPSASKEPVEVDVYARRRLQPGHRFDGPAIVEQYDATTVVCPEQTARVDEYGNLIITRPGSR